MSRSNGALHLSALFAMITFGSAMSPASARRVAVDVNLHQITPCVFGAAATCAPLDVGFDVSARGGPSTQLFIYSNGLVGINQPLPPTLVSGGRLNESSLDYFAPAVLADVPSNFTVYAEKGFGQDFFDPDTGVFLPNEIDNASFRIDWRPSYQSAQGDTGSFQLDISRNCLRARPPACRSADDVFVDYNYGDVPGLSPIPDDTPFLPVLPVGTQIAINYLQYQSNMTYREETNLDDTAIRYIFSAVPEPRTWMEIMLGFGIIGGTWRASRRSAVANTAVNAG